MPLPQELLDAVAAALDRDALEDDLEKRAQLLAVTRTTLAEWMEGSITTAEALAILHSAAPP